MKVSAHVMRVNTYRLLLRKQRLDMPKSGYSANPEAKICATNIVALMNGRGTTEISGINWFSSSVISSKFSYSKPEVNLSMSYVRLPNKRIMDHANPN